MPSINNKICHKCNKIVKLPHNCQDKEKATAAKMYNKTKRVNQQFYSSQPWRKKRLSILARDCGLCQECSRNGRVTIGNIVHHIIELKDDYDLGLIDSNLETICATCHNQEHADHISYGAIFPDIEPLKNKVVIIFGAPACGKSWYAKSIKREQDLIVDLDEIRADVLNTKIYNWKDGEGLSKAIIKRNSILKKLASHNEYDIVYMILSTPKAKDRKFWKDKLNAQVIYIDQTKKVCIDRAMNDDRRHDKGLHKAIINKWFSKFEYGYITKTIRT